MCISIKNKNNKCLLVLLADFNAKIKCIYQAKKKRNNINSPSSIESIVRRYNVLRIRTKNISSGLSGRSGR